MTSYMYTCTCSGRGALNTSHGGVHVSPDPYFSEEDSELRTLPLSEITKQRKIIGSRGTRVTCKLDKRETHPLDVAREVRAATKHAADRENRYKKKTQKLVPEM